MSCFFCIKVAEFKCGCQQAFYMCKTHLEIHLKTFTNHKPESLDVTLDPLRLKNLKLETFIRIQKIIEAEKMIAYTIKSLIKTIEKAYKEAIGRLDILKKTYNEILVHNMFCTSDLPLIKKIETKEFKVKTVETDKIINLISRVYAGKFVNNVWRVDGYIEMSMKQKIDYFYPIVLKNNWINLNLNICHRDGRELLISNNGQYLFYCKLHLGILYLDCNS